MRVGMVCVAFALCACAGVEAVSQYQATPLASFMDAQDTWRIFDKPTEGRLMIMPSIGRGVGAGIADGLSLGTFEADFPKPEYQRAIQGWMASAERLCMVTDGYKLMKQRWEFTYRCN